ncbi:hypothetical protein VQ042_21865 [Aurantimonas sp. A2-1-M11]|uniref:hypothetical protein n=1 Tax=Aurantimonas sp. A2-1-M11 TaxID=3113712 RepID=UPI002F94A960
MGQISRRVVAVGTGVAIIALEAAGIKPSALAQSPGQTQQVFFERACTDHGGRIVGTMKDERGKVSKYVCHLTDLPRLNTQCSKRLDDDGKPMTYDIDRRQCVEDCFLTAACVDMLGLKDDCFELQALRRFRDTRMAGTPEGGADIEAYYRTTSAISDRIRSSANPKAELLRLYAKFILPSALASSLGLDGMARAIYPRMMADLSQRYGVPLAVGAGDSSEVRSG